MFSGNNFTWHLKKNPAKICNLGTHTLRTSTHILQQIAFAAAALLMCMLGI